MQIENILMNKANKPKDNLETLVNHIQRYDIFLGELVDYAKNAKEAHKATCIEALEYITKENPGFIDKSVFHFVCDNLLDKSPRVIWESSKVIGNTAKIFPDLALEVVGKLLANAEYNGTVVKWSTAYALSEIYLLKTAINADLEPALKNIADREENNGVKNIYLKAFKKMEKMNKPAKVK